VAHENSGKYTQIFELYTRKLHTFIGAQYLPYAEKSTR